MNRLCPLLFLSNHIFIWVFTKIKSGLQIVSGQYFPARMTICLGTMGLVYSRDPLKNPTYRGAQTTLSVYLDLVWIGNIPGYSELNSAIDFTIHGSVVGDDRTIFAVGGCREYLGGNIRFSNKIAYHAHGTS